MVIADRNNPYITNQNLSHILVFYASSKLLHHETIGAIQNELDLTIFRECERSQTDSDDIHAFSFSWKGKQFLQVVHDYKNGFPTTNNEIVLVYYAPVSIDRSCLIELPVLQRKEAILLKFSPHLFDASDLINAIIHAIDKSANLFRLNNGDLSELGKILNHNTLYYIPESSIDRPLVCPTIDYNHILQNPDIFVSKYWLHQKPVIILNYPILTQYYSREEAILELLMRYGGKKVGCKLSPDSDFEGVDSLLNWGMSATQKVLILLLAFYFQFIDNFDYYILDC